MVKQKKIMLPTVADAKEFVARASRCDFDIDIFYNRVVIDAKSILGVLSLDLTRELTVTLNGDDPECWRQIRQEKAKNASRPNR